MPINKDDQGVIQYTPKSDRFETVTTGVHPADSIFVCDNVDQLKQLGFDLGDMPTNTRVIFKLLGPEFGGDITLTFPGRNAEIGTATRLVVEKIATETVSANKLVYATDTQSVGIADYLSDTKNVVLGLAITSALTGDMVQILLSGEQTDPFFTFDINEPLYLGLNGAVTDVPPDTGYQAQVGSSSGDNTINIRIERVIKL